jgi:hypothetical protein
METMWKFVFDMERSPTLEISTPRGSHARFVGLDPASGNPAIWFLVPKVATEKVERTFVIYGTGHRIHQFSDYVGSVIQGQFVWHIFESLL